MASDGSRQFSGIRDAQRSSEQRTLWRYFMGLVCWDVDREFPRRRMIHCRGLTGGVGGQGRRWDLPWREV